MCNKMIRHRPIGQAIILLLLFACLPTMATDLQGHFTQGGLVYGKVMPGSVVWFDGDRLPLSSGGEFIIGFAYQAPAYMVLRVDYKDQTNSQQIPIAQRQYQVQRIDGLPPAKVFPPKQVWARIREENQMIGRARRHSTFTGAMPKSFIWPLLGKVSGVYGSRRILNGQERQAHYGIDIACQAGTNVQAPANGIVRLVHEDMYFSGKTIIIDHGYGISSTLMHLSQTTVEEGAQVRQGDLIAKVGSTGRSTGAHLDWRVNWLNVRLDPELLANAMPANAKCPE